MQCGRGTLTQQTKGTRAGGYYTTPRSLLLTIMQGGRSRRKGGRNEDGRVGKVAMPM